MPIRETKREIASPGSLRFRARWHKKVLLIHVDAQNLPQGVSPRSVQTSSGNYNYTATQLSNGWTVVDLTKFPSFPSWSGGSPAAFTAALQLNLRNTLPNSTPGKLFTQSGLAVPFSTAQYLGNNQGWMGPYAPIVSYQPISSSGLSALGLPTFPTGGQPTSDPLTNAGNIKLSQSLLQNYPEQYWPSGTTAPQYLICGTQALTPKINFVGTQFSVPVDDPHAFSHQPDQLRFSGCQQ